MTFQTEFEFTLPKGFVDTEGTLHKAGVMRLATAADEILPQKDPRVHQNPAYLVVILLSRVITRVGEISNVTPKTIEELFSKDLAYLQDFYQDINENGSANINTVCPKCEHQFEVESRRSGES
jgi:phage FluMu protein gp41